MEPGLKHYRTLFVSDIHLGAKTCRADLFLDFLKYHEAETIYLVGDIIDFWRIRKGGAIWPQVHNDVIQKLLRRIRKGTRIIYIPGNHDEAMRDYCGSQFGGLELMRQAIHETPDGRRFLIIHGDEFDVVVRYHKWLAYLGDWAYETALSLNTHLNRIRHYLGKPYWSLSAYLKYKVKSAVNFIGEFELALANEASRQQVQGVICGHIHHAAIRQIDDILYMNTGDWVESCTALGETHDGHFEIIRWTNQVNLNHSRVRLEEDFEEKDLELVA